jgi:cytoskeletal protein CcmA (bactofilin family)
MKLIRSSGETEDFGIISRGVEVSGEIVFTDRLQVEGKVIGKLVSESGTLVIEEMGQVHAQVDVGVCIVRGNLNGDINVRTRVEIHRTGRVQGDMVTPVLIVEEGAVFNGVVKMTQESEIELPQKGGRLIEEILPEHLVKEERRSKGA